MNTIGLDIGITAGGVMAWGVFAPTAGPMYGGLAGTYVGASGSIGVGVGVGANLLFGGTGRSIALQPSRSKDRLGSIFRLEFRVSLSGWRNEDTRERCVARRAQFFALS
jgi:hypothetical protein